MERAMQETPEFPLRVFYDGGCSVCSTEMKAYRSREYGGRLVFINIKAPGFDPAPYGITGKEFMHELHAIDREGRVYRGVDALRVIWRAFPASSRYGLLAGLIALPGIDFLARQIYRSFARIRKHLPKM
jgi:predicted DCC family thiol-disulfide oxidoreductase YuxK